MNSKERVKRAIEFKNPDRVPYNFDSNRTPLIEWYGDDFEWVFTGANPNFKPSVKTETAWETEWGVVYESLGTLLGEAKVFPLEDLSKVYEYSIPDFTCKERYIEMEKIIGENPDKYILGMFPNFLFLHLLDLVGFENLMFALIDYEEEVQYIIERLTEQWISVVDCMKERGVDGMIAIEDLGVQDRLIISPPMWRRFFKPAYKQIIDKLHDNDMHFFIHSCGHILDLIEDLIEIGVDVIQIDQQENMGIPTLADKYGGRVCFFCPCDIQKVLPNGSKEEIEESVKQLIEAFGKYNGGFMAKTYPQPDSIDIPEENTAYMCEMFKKWGGYPLQFKG